VGVAAIERHTFDHTSLEEVMAHLDAVVRHAPYALSGFAANRSSTEAPAVTRPGMRRNQ
jgi:hypothetical protein